MIALEEPVTELLPFPLGGALERELFVLFIITVRNKGWEERFRKNDIPAEI